MAHLFRCTVKLIALDNGLWLLGRGGERPMCVTATIKRKRRQAKNGFRGVMHPMRRPRTKKTSVTVLERREQQRREKAKAMTSRKKSGKK